MQNTISNWKTCPKCTKLNKGDVTSCLCGYEFSSGNSHPHTNPIPQASTKPVVVKKRKKYKRVHPLISCGGWVNDSVKGMPNVDMPKPLEKDNKITNEELLDYISYEGLGFCVLEYIDADKIEDSNVAEKWEKAKMAMEEVINMLCK